MREKIKKLPSLLLVGHGSNETDQAKKAMTDHAEILREKGHFLDVMTYFLSDGAPLPQRPKGDFFIVPFFMSDGYFSGPKIRQLFGMKHNQVQDERGQVMICPPVGVLPQMSGLLLKVVREACEKHGIQEAQADIVIAAHGSSKSSASRNATLFHANALRDTDRFANVREVFLEEEPFVRDWAKKRSDPSRMTIVLGLFSAEGPHSMEDVPKALKEGAIARDVDESEWIYTGPVGLQADMVRLVETAIAQYNVGQ
ncbi:CbiX/SirB N-terminal domain-containing protein [Sneathiella aquimaris]|uniref:CbiX/SirB N-terminal domain-containing protein n=1 Tax=Sneathiella aquimaris TaxID=2599305 RepID=UPI00146CE504|nr:CbiX/SirB N-terminal domain-containing protein [Sneathiella aquimaris]